MSTKVSLRNVQFSFFFIQKVKLKKVKFTNKNRKQNKRKQQKRKNKKSGMHAFYIQAL